MRTFVMADTDLHKLFVHTLKDVYFAESAITKALPKMQKAATSEELQKAFADHLEATKGHVTRLEHASAAMLKAVKSLKPT